MTDALQARTTSGFRLAAMSRRSRFVRPDSRVFQESEAGYRGAFRTYSQYNYLRPGLIPWLKCQRFEIALRLAEPQFGRGTAADFGCADGVLLPSLARAFPRAVGIDIDRGSTTVASAVVADLGLHNVDVCCSDTCADGIPSIHALPNAPFRVMFLLETLEHIGEPGNLVSIQRDFVAKLFELVETGGQIIVSVPRMVGSGFLAKYLARRLLRIRGDAITWGEAMRAGLLHDTRDLAAQWSGSHEGFNDVALERALSQTFRLVRKRTTLFTRFWVLERR
jgi:2-polyprenyl-3-methyl-5-hydroxy-6-metoxy-1,4-benzoquinol methylase